VQHGAVLRGVDVLAAEHGLDLLLQPRALRQLDEQLQRLLRHALPRKVHVHAVVLHQALLEALLVLHQLLRCLL